MTAEEVSQKHLGQRCPKEPWVMLTFSDDEALPDDGAIPPGLGFHLDRCPSCRSIADRLSTVTAGLGALRVDDPVEELSRRALMRTRAALDAGAETTGRVEVDDGPIPGLDDYENARVGISFVGVGRIGVLAACIGLVVVSIAMWRMIEPPEPATRLAENTAPASGTPSFTPDAQLAETAVERSSEPLMTSDHGECPSTVGPDSIYAYPGFGVQSDFFAGTTHRPVTPRSSPDAYRRSTKDGPNPERILDNSTESVSTMLLTKDRQ